MNLLPEIESWLLQQGHDAPFTGSSVSGGSICDSRLAETADGHRYFIKSKANAPAGLFPSEAEGLKAIAATRSIVTPKVYHYAESFLVLEFLPSRSPSGAYWTDFGRQLAAMHRHTFPQFGFSMDNFCGSTPQPNPPTSDGYRFFAEQRLLHQTRLATANRLLDARDAAAVENLCSRLTDLIPEQPASLLHGDLWSGNAHIGEDGEPVLIDPACYWGWAEAEIAMTRLFGGFPDAFYRSYLEVNPLQPGWQERLDLYNLYHLLNHLNLFGSSYYAQVISALKRYQ